MKRFSAKQIRGSDKTDVAFHAPRYAFTLEILEKYVQNSDTRVLDIGKSRLTGLIKEAFGVRVDSLGFGEDEARGDHTHYGFDLNCSQWEESWRTDIPRYDILVMAEVIEHLHTAPNLVLSFLRTLLKDRGVLLLSTPNAVALGKRLGLLFGRNPYALIEENVHNPGHFREYTMTELELFAAQSGFLVEKRCFTNFLDYRYCYTRTPGQHHMAEISNIKGVGSLISTIYTLVPARLKPCIFMVCRKSNRGSLT